VVVSLGARLGRASFSNTLRMPGVAPCMSEDALDADKEWSEDDTSPWNLLTRVLFWRHAIRVAFDLAWMR